MTEEEMQARISELEAAVTKAENDKKAALGEKHSANAALRAAQDAADEAAEKAERDAKDVEALEKRLTTKFEKQIRDLETARDTATAQLRTTLVDNEIAKALRDNSVREGMDEALSALFQSKVKFENGEATIEGKTIGEFAGEYLGSAAGAFFRRPSDNSGADASGNITKTVHAKLTKRPSSNAEWDVLDSMEKAERNAFADSINAPDLKV